MSKDVEILQKHVSLLAEHFDSVQVFATRKVEDGTINVFDGQGNWFARYGQVRMWVKREERQEAERMDEED